MHITVVVLITILVTKVTCVQDYDQELADYSNQDSASESNEVSNDVDSDANDGSKPKRARVTVTATYADDKETTNNLNTTQAIATYALPDCRDQPDQPTEKSDENKCSSTLINYPFAVSIQKKGAHYTTGALLDKRWIVSVAAEFYNVRESTKIFRARLGSVDCKKGGTVVPLKRVEIHPSYIYGSPNFDVSLLKMAQPVDYTDYIRPIGLSNVKRKVLSAKFLTTYWPRLIVKGTVLPEAAKERVKQNSMRVSTQRLIPQEKCLNLTHNVNVTLEEATLCLKPVITHHSPCLPDAGAPVVAEDGLWGITSGWISEDCKVFQSPTLFTRLSERAVRSWLDTQMLSI